VVERFRSRNMLPMCEGRDLGEEGIREIFALIR
jgi:hypothetical protein